MAEDFPEGPTLQGKRNSSRLTHSNSVPPSGAGQDKLPGPGRNTVRINDDARTLQWRVPNLTEGKLIVYTVAPLFPDKRRLQDSPRGAPDQRINNVFRVTDSVRVPVAYAIPPEWSTVIERMRLHGIHMTRLKNELTVDAGIYRLNDAKWQERPYEGRHGVRYKAELNTERWTLPSGTAIVPTGQRAANVIVNLLEPTAPDAFSAWGFFDAIFEQKEYGEGYVLEKLAREMMSANPGLRKEFEMKLAVDSTFAKNPYARLNFFYQRSPQRDSTIRTYPVVRLENAGDVAKAFRKLHRNSIEKVIPRAN